MLCQFRDISLSKYHGEIFAAQSPASPLYKNIVSATDDAYAFTYLQTTIMAIAYIHGLYWPSSGLSANEMTITSAIASNSAFVTDFLTFLSRKVRLQAKGASINVAGLALNAFVGVDSNGNAHSVRTAN